MNALPRPVGFAALGTLVTAGLTASAVAQGGEDAATAVPITIPGTVTGTTVGFTDDSDEVCPYDGSTSPDVYYSYVSTEGALVELELCESGYDTKLYVYDADLELILDIYCQPACNDDACSSSGGGGFRSALQCIEFRPNELYYIVVDGWSGAAGPYRLTADFEFDCPVPGPCIIDCPPGSIMEGEPCDFGNTAPDDLFNGGCDCSDPAGCFQEITCDTIICGQGSFDGAFRDTDWFSLDVSGFTEGVVLQLSGASEFNCVVGRIENGVGTLGCDAITGFAEMQMVPRCDPIGMETDVLAGSLAILFIGADFSATVNCLVPPTELCEQGPDYVLRIDCLPEPLPCPWDLDGSGQVNFADLLKVLSNWGACPS